MTETTARAALFELQSSQSPSYTWAVAQKPVCVRIPFPVIDRLEQQAVESFRSLSSKGSEIGGLLFGKVSPGEPREVSIEDYELIACDYSRGPLYRLSEVDMGRFDRAILQHNSAGSLAVIGFFRSHTRKGLTLDAEDLAFFDSRFREPHQITLLIRPFANKPSTAGIFIREGGSVQTDTSYLEFPFRSSLLSPERPESLESKPAASPSASGMGTSLPAPAVPRTTMRGQIVPIASRREMAPAIPELAEEEVTAQPNGETAELQTAVATPEKPLPAVNDLTQLATHVEEQVAPPKTGEPAALPKLEEKAAPKADEKAAPIADEKAAPKADEKNGRPKTPEKSTKPKVEEKPTPAKAAPPRRTPEPAAATSTAAAPSAAAATSPAAATKAASAVAPAVPARGRGKMLWIGLGAAIPVIVLVAFLAYPPLLHRNRPTAPQDSSQLSLRVERTAGEILLTWNRDSDAIRTASHAVLSISDGDQHENVEMDLTQLRNGSISYSPSSGDVVFRMEVTGKSQEKTASESVRALRTRPSPLAGPDSATQPGAQTPATGAASPAAAAAKPPVNTAPNSNPAANAANGTPPTAPAAQEEAPVKTPDRPLKPFQAPSLAQRLHPAASTDLPDAPAVRGVPSSGTTAVTGLNMNSVSAPVAPAAPAPAPPSAPVADKKAASGGQIQQAVLIAKKDPEYPKLARETGAKGVVQLVATIGTDGKVKSVKVVKGPPMLQKAASDAVMQWRYKPTILNGVPVEAQTEVFVNFLGAER